MYPRRLLAPVAILGAALLAGCSDGSSGSSGDVLCTTIGYSSTLMVEVGGEADSVEEVRLCIEDVCAPVPEPEPTATGDWMPAEVTRTGDDWRFTLFSTPEEVTVEMVHDDGTVTSQVRSDVAWERVGGTEECGGPHAATVAVTA